MRKQFEELHPLFDLEKDEQGGYMCVLTRVTWLGFELGKKTLQAEIDQLKTQLNNMEACYIGKKKQVEAVSQVLCELKESLKDFQEVDLYDKGYRVTTEYVIADLEQALRGEHENN